MSIENMPELSVLKREEQFNAIKFWSSRFNFLDITNGIRPARVSYLMGTTGTGKTTLAASIISDSAKDSKILVVLSEESPIRYAKNIYKASNGAGSDNIKFLSEKEMPEEIRGDQRAIMAWLEMHIIESGVRLVFWDNLTSSQLFKLEFGPRGQEWAVNRIREVCESLEVAFFIIMHTAKNVTDNMGRYIEGEDVRGTQQTFIAADFFYIFQRFAIDKAFFPFIRIIKHRGFNPREKVFLLQFGNECYQRDAVSSYEEMNEIFMKRNVLGKSQKKNKDSYGRF